ncbi:MAG TPA: hypothetical protein VNW94_28195, partial [Streptosporangiaceae bacterium]|nr:hypothetical protein [Streptosporangiaceae bacterium]
AQDEFGQAACTGTVGPRQELSDTWAFADGVWKRLAAGGHVPQSGQLLSSDPAISAIVLVGHTLAHTDATATQDTPGTWKWTGHRWSLLSHTTPTAASSLAYDPVSRRLLAYGGQQPYTAGPGMGVPNLPGYSRTWAFTGTSWVELHPATTPDQAPGVLTASPDGHRLLLINTFGQTWIWTGQDWQRHPTRGGPTGSHGPWIGPLSAAADPSSGQIVLLVPDSNSDDQTWTLHADTWTHHPATP